MKRIRVLHLIGDLSVGGAQAMLHKLLMRADRERFEPSVIELTDRGDGFRSKIRELGIQVTSVGMGRAPGPKSLWKLAQAVRARKPDVISAWMYHSNLMAVLIQPLLERRVPVIFGIRQSLYDLSTEKRATQWVIRAGVKLSDRAARIVYNAQISSEQHEALGYDKSRRVIIPNGFDCDRFKPNPEARERIRRELGLPPGAGLIGLLARYHPVKDHATFLSAAAQLHRECPEVHFLLAGEGTEASNAELTEVIERAGIASVVHRLGLRSDTADLNAALDIAALSSRFEGFPNVIGEAMACAVPCVGTDVGEVRHLIDDCGRVVPPQDAEAMGAALTELWRMGPDHRAELGRRARARVQENFDLAVAARKFEQLYAEVS